MSAVLPHLEITPQRPHWLDGAPGFEPGNGGIKIHLFCLPFNGHSEKSTKFDPFQSIGWMLIPNAPPRKPCGAPLSIAASGVLTSWSLRLCVSVGGVRPALE